MAFPTNLIQSDDFAESGVILGLHPSSDRSFDIRLQRQDTGTTWRAIQVWQGNSYNGAFQYRDLLPNDHLRRDYRARHEKSGYTAGAWTATVSGGPTLLSAGDAPQVPVSGQRMTLPIYLSTAATLAIRSQTGTSTGAVLKVVRFGAANFPPASTNSGWTYSEGLLQPTQGVGGDDYEGTLILPKGVTVRAARIRGKKLAAGGQCEMILRTVSNGSTIADIVTLSLTTINAAFQTKASSTFTPQAVGDNVWYGHLSLVSTGATQTYFMFLELDYSMPSYDKAL